ncbi:microtubule associated protein-domain-containing protein [Cokeromyces recurvatus]|uniref:microtubule associated protein-domain-containing protein n=1 Tax=Cokeromyces recurvatus TaxID=90255 RepID=UPI00221F6C32|nr:microtubule associated protein-domain-containing protein [Cokeromyces recurvatus]KAI7899233.1 microtubule associated protein-domain-containing protein [Cokeromyces recurvatus]
MKTKGIKHKIKFVVKIDDIHDFKHLEEEESSELHNSDSTTIDILQIHEITLWSSLDIDHFTIDKKLQPIINDFEKLIFNEKKEKDLLAATIEDIKESIDSASQLLGVSVDCMVYSTIDKDNHIVVSPIIRNEFYDLRPTYSKYKALSELNSRLTYEVAIRKQHLKTWLFHIQILCKQLCLPYKFKTIQATCIKQLNTCIQSIQFYYHLLQYNPQKENYMSTLNPPSVYHQYILATLFENHPLKSRNSKVIDINTYLNDLPNPINYYMQPCIADHLKNDLVRQDTLNQFSQHVTSLKSLYETRCRSYRYSVNKIKALWEELEIPIAKRSVLPTFLGKKSILVIKQIVDKVEYLKRKHFNEYFQQLILELTPLWDSCFIIETERNEFISTLYKKNVKSEIKLEVERHMTSLKQVQHMAKALHLFIQKRKDLIQEMIDFEKTATDPKRLFKASFQLIKEEKWRKSCYPRLLRLNRQLIKSIQEFERFTACRSERQRSETNLFRLLE